MCHCRSRADREPTQRQATGRRSPRRDGGCYEVDAVLWSSLTLSGTRACASPGLSRPRCQVAHGGHRGDGRRADWQCSGWKSVLARVRNCRCYCYYYYVIIFYLQAYGCKWSSMDHACPVSTIWRHQILRVAKTKIGQTCFISWRSTVDSLLPRTQRIVILVIEIILQAPNLRFIFILTLHAIATLSANCVYEGYMFLLRQLLFRQFLFRQSLLWQTLCYSHNCVGTAPAYESQIHSLRWNFERDRCRR